MCASYTRTASTLWYNGSMIKLMMTWNIRDEQGQEYLEFVTREFVPLLMRYGAISDAWLGVAGASPEMIMGIVSDDELELRSLITTDEWHTLHQRLQDYVNDFRAWFTTTIQKPGGFQM